MTVSDGQQRDSAIHIHVSILLQTPLPSRLPHNTEQSSFQRPHFLIPCDWRLGFQCNNLERRTQISKHYHIPVQFSLVAQLCPTLCNPVDCSTPGFLVHHQLLEFTQTHVHWVSDAIQPCHPLSSPLLPLSVFPSTRVFSNESVLHIRWLKYWSFSFSISPSNEYSGLSSFRPYSKYIIYLYFHFPMRLVLFRSHFTDKKIKTRED